MVPTESGADGNELVIFNDELIELVSSKWNLTVCGKFVGCTVSFNEAKYHIKRMWSRFGLKDMIDNDSGTLFFKIHDKEGIQEVINNGPWMVNNKPLFVQR